jgi:hypothetical protein
MKIGFSLLTGAAAGGGEVDAELRVLAFFAVGDVEDEAVRDAAPAGTWLVGGAQAVRLVARGGKDAIERVLVLHMISPRSA